MGLDMYLYRSDFVAPGGQFAGDTGWNAAVYAALVEHLDAPTERTITGGMPSANVRIRVAYWRKANQIHRWFVENVQRGEDDCGEYYVGDEELAELSNLCEHVLATRDPSLLPPSSGFFFGGTEIDEWYWKDLEHTVEMLRPLIGDTRDGIYYRSPW